MIIKDDICLHDFDFWGGAIFTTNQLTRADLDIIEEYIDELYPDGVNAGTLNDMFWFEPEFIAEILGITYDYDTGKFIR